VFATSIQQQPRIAETNSIGPPGRAADCYVFCVFTDMDRSDCVVHDVSRWQFYVVPTPAIETAFGSQKSVRLSRLSALCSPVGYANLRTAINRALDA